MSLKTAQEKWNNLSQEKREELIYREAMQMGNKNFYFFLELCRIIGKEEADKLVKEKITKEEAEIDV